VQNSLVYTYWKNIQHYKFGEKMANNWERMMYRFLFLVVSDRGKSLKETSYVTARPPVTSLLLVALG